MPQRKPEVTRRTAAGIPYELTRKKVKRLNLHIRRDGTVAVSIPWSYTVGFADAFVTEQAQWIREAVSRQLRRNARNDQPLPSKAEALACFTAMSDKVYPAFACGLYALLCLLPAGIALRDIRHRWPLVGFSAVLGPALYFLINPGLLAQRMGGLPQEVVVAMLGQLIWAVALACAVWLLLGALHRRSLNASSLLHGMQIGLCLLDGAFVVSVFGVGVLDLRGQIAAVRQANTMLDNTSFGTLNPTALFLVCGWLVQSLPALLNLGIVHGLLQLVKLAKADRFAPGMAQAAAHCGTLAGGAAAVDVTVQAVFLAVQLCAAGQLHQLNSGLHIALLPILFAVAALLFSRWLAEGYALREENEGFI